MPNNDFYRIDTAIVTPSVDLASWSLRIHGLVETYALAIKRSQPPATYLMPIRRALPMLASLLA